MSQTFIALGCSCTAVVGWTRHFREELKLNLVDLSEGSSSNLSQIIKLKNYLLHSGMVNKLNQVVLLWQITSPARKTFVLEKSMASSVYQNNYVFPEHEDYRDYFTYKLNFEQKEVIGLLSHNPFFEDKKFDLNSTDAEFEQVIFDIVILSKLVKHTVIWYGWKDIDTPARLENINNFLNQQENISLIPLHNSFVDWCREKKLDFHLDREHPTAKSSIEWGKQILLPTLQKILPNLHN